MSIGLTIKQERIKQNIKQSILAEGICSISYLSKIENNQTIPSDEVIDLLLKRLNVTITELSSDEEDQHILTLSAIYKEAVIYRDKEKIREYVQLLAKNTMQFNKNAHYNLSTLYIFRLYLILDSNLEEMASLVQFIETLEKYAEDKERFIMNLDLGLYHSLDQNHDKALTYFEKALEVSRTASLEDWEIADFYHALSLAYFHKNDLHRSDYYATEALQIYKDHLLLNRAIDCYIGLGNIHKILFNFDEAEKNYLLAQRIAEDFKLRNYEGIIYQNLGSLMARKNNFESAIKYYKLSLDRKERGTESYLITVLSIVQEYSKHNHHIEVNRWCEHGLESIGKNRNKFMKPYLVHFNIYQALHKNDEKLESVLNRGIKFFEERGDSRNVQKYSFLIADYYSRNKKYKASTQYFQKAKNVLFTQKSINHWEDL